VSIGLVKSHRLRAARGPAKRASQRPAPGPANERGRGTSADGPASVRRRPHPTADPVSGPRTLGIGIEGMVPIREGGDGS